MQTFISRLIAPLAGGFTTWLAGRGFELDVTATESFLVAVGLGVYGVVHKLIDRKINPQDKAK